MNLKICWCSNIILTLLLVILSLTLFFLYDTSTREDEEIALTHDEFRLPTAVIPFHYDLRIRPRLTLNDKPQFTAPGKVRILVECVNETGNITLHAEVREINESSVTITNLNTGAKVPVTNQFYWRYRRFYVIELGRKLQTGERYSMEIEYVANVYKNASMNGLHRSYFDEPETGIRRWYAVSQLQEIFARDVFPCFDEPALKATFNITIGRESNFTTLSNTPLISSVPIPGLDGWFWDTFKKTARMSTYLVAFVISDYDYVKAPQELYHKPTRTYGPKDLIQKGYGDYSAQVAAKNLAFFSEYFDYDYVMEKADSVASWEFFDGAMENWGLNIYRYNSLLYNPAENTELERRDIAQIMAHEISHNWFGNLVTFAWWTDLWLNEGIASYFEYLGLNHTDPEFECLKTMQIDTMQRAMRADVLSGSHPTRLPDKGNPYDMMSYWGDLVYSKGAALIRMVEHFLTKETFQQAIRDYLKRYAFASVVQDQFFEVLEEHAKADERIPTELSIKAIMDTWTLQKSYPLVKVRLHETQNTVTLTQEEDTDRKFKGSLTDDPLWYIPMAVSTKSDPQPSNTFPKYWLTKKEISIPHNSSDWIVINSGATGYYRVKYDKVLTTRLHKQIEEDFTLLNYGTRSQLIDDYFTQAYKGDQPIGAALGFTKHFANELEYVVWAPFLYHMEKPFRLFQGTKVFDDLKEYILPKIDSVMGRLERERNISVGITNIFYTQLADWACTMGHGGCINMSMSLFEEWKKNPERNPVPVGFRSVVYCTAVANSMDNFQFALERLNVSKGTQKKELLRALGCTKEKDKAKLLLQAVIGSCNQTSEELTREALPSLAANQLQRERLSQSLEDSIRTITDCEWGKDSISKVFSSLSKYYQDLFFLKKLKRQNWDLFSETGMSLDVIDTIEKNILFVSKFATQFHEWFKENKF